LGDDVRKLIFAVVLLFFGLTFAKEAVIPVELEPVHKVVLKNEYVEVIHAALPPGESTLLHSHAHARVAVNLSEATVKEAVPGKRSAQTLSINAGSFSLQDYDKRPFTHRITNVGKALFEALDVELLSRPEGPPTEPIAVPAAESKAFRVYKWTLVPGASTPEHAHSRPYLIIAASPMQLSMASPDGATMEHPVKAGDFHWISNKVTHKLTNKGKEAGTLIEVEVR
jgi:mannose-6-phosphate isomerase-like protein (cupin superfamily)